MNSKAHVKYETIMVLLKVKIFEKIKSSSIGYKMKTLGSRNTQENLKAYKERF